MSILFNRQARVEEKDYYEDLIGTYQQQFAEESQQVMDIIHLEEKKHLVDTKVEQLESKIR